MIVTLIEKVYSFLWGDLVQIPLPGGSTLGISLLIILLIPTGIYFTVRTRFLPIRLFPDMVQASSRTFKSNGRTYMEKHNDNTLNTVLYQKVSGRYKQVAKSSRYLIYRFSYGKKLYFSSADDETSDIPWVIFEHFLGM